MGAPDDVTVLKDTGHIVSNKHRNVPAQKKFRGEGTFFVPAHLGSDQGYLI